MFFVVAGVMDGCVVGPSETLNVVRAGRPTLNESKTWSVLSKRGRVRSDNSTFNHSKTRLVLSKRVSSRKRTPHS